jgi:hypothetical protein
MSCHRTSRVVRITEAADIDLQLIKFSVSPLSWWGAHFELYFLFYILKPNNTVLLKVSPHRTGSVWS